MIQEQGLDSRQTTLIMTDSNFNITSTTTAPDDVTLKLVDLSEMLAGRSACFRGLFRMFRVDAFILLRAANITCRDITLLKHYATDFWAVYIIFKSCRLLKKTEIQQRLKMLIHLSFPSYC